MKIKAIYQKNSPFTIIIECDKSPDKILSNLIKDKTLINKAAFLDIEAVKNFFAAKNVAAPALDSEKYYVEISSTNDFNTLILQDEFKACFTPEEFESLEKALLSPPTSTPEIKEQENLAQYLPSIAVVMNIEVVWDQKPSDMALLNTKNIPKGICDGKRWQRLVQDNPYICWFAVTSNINLVPSHLIFRHVGIKNTKAFGKQGYPTNLSPDKIEKLFSKLKIPNCVTDVNKEFQEFHQDGQIDPDLIKSVLDCFAVNGDVTSEISNRNISYFLAALHAIRLNSTLKDVREIPVVIVVKDQSQLDALGHLKEQFLVIAKMLETIKLIGRADLEKIKFIPLSCDNDLRPLDIKISQTRAQQIDDLVKYAQEWEIEKQCQLADVFLQIIQSGGRAGNVYNAVTLVKYAEARYEVKQAPNVLKAISTINFKIGNFYLKYFKNPNHMNVTFYWQKAAASGNVEAQRALKAAEQQSEVAVSEVLRCDPKDDNAEPLSMVARLFY